MRERRDEASVQITCQDHCFSCPLPKIILKQVKRLLALCTVIFLVCFVSSMALGWPFTKELNGLFDRHCHGAFDLRSFRNEWTTCRDSAHVWTSYLTSCVALTSTDLLTYPRLESWHAGDVDPKHLRRRKSSIHFSKTVSPCKIIDFYPPVTYCVEHSQLFLGNLYAQNVA